MMHALTRNRTYRALDQLGMYTNIRTFKNGAHTALFDRDVGSNYVTPPPPPPSGNYDGTGAPSINYGWVHPNSSTTDEFSASEPQLVTSLPPLAPKSGFKMHFAIASQRLLVLGGGGGKIRLEVQILSSFS